MNPTQVKYFSESVQYCNKLLSMLEREKDTIRACFREEPLQAYLKATDEAINYIKKIRSDLHALQSMQQ